MDNAEWLATRAHFKQKRKYTGEAYIEHPRAVAALVAQTGLDPEVVEAAWLHDVVEDTNMGIERIEEEFGARVAHLVYLMTDESYVKGGPNRASRKAKTKYRIFMTEGQVAIDIHTLKAADLLHNSYSIKEHDPDFWVVFKREAIELFNVLVLANPNLMDLLADMLEVEKKTHDRQFVWSKNLSTGKWALND